ncbi:MAG: MinD/ParA family protein [Defluviitaleaceae bacterium]|nr:MinD/ParA family protein [Defluviitaleaceae bacterium]
MIIDQARRLRELMLESNNAAQPEKIKTTMSARVISIASGKGGVGKSNFTINLAIQMRKLGKRVAIIDADFGLANVEILLGVAPKYTVADVLNGTVDMESALTIGPMGCMFLSGGSGMAALTDLTDNQISRLTQGFIQLDSLVDYILIDTRAGISNAVTNFIRASSDTIVVTTPDPTAIADAYALIKSVKATMPDIGVLKLVINCVMSEAEANDVFEKLNGVSARFLGIKLLFLGYIPFDSYLVRAVRKQRPVSMQYPFAESANKYSLMCANLLNMEASKKGNIQNFVMKLIGRFA